MDFGLSTRGLNFLHKWMSENVPENPPADPGLMTDLADRMTADAIKAGIRPREIEEEVDSIFAVMVEAVAMQGGGEIE